MGYTIGYTNTKYDIWVCLKMGNGPPRYGYFNRHALVRNTNISDAAFVWCCMKCAMILNDISIPLSQTSSNEEFKQKNTKQKIQLKFFKGGILQLKFFPKITAKSQGVHPINSRPGARWGIWNPNHMKNPMKNHGKTMEIIQNTMKRYEKTVIYAMKCHEILWNHGIWKSIQIVMEYAANICQCYA